MYGCLLGLWVAGICPVHLGPLTGLYFFVPVRKFWAYNAFWTSRMLFSFLSTGKLCPCPILNPFRISQSKSKANTTSDWVITKADISGQSLYSGRLSVLYTFHQLTPMKVPRNRHDLHFTYRPHCGHRVKQAVKPELLIKFLSVPGDLKIEISSQVWWYVPLISALRRWRQVELWFWGHPVLCRWPVHTI